MKDAGVDFISTCIDQNSVLILEQELERQGMGDVVVALPQGYADAQFVSDNAALLEGDILGVPYRPLEADPGDSGVQTMIDAFAASGAQLTDYAIQGYLGAQLAVAGILAAGPQFDRETVVAATNAITDWTASGMVPTVDWSTAHTAPTEGEDVTGLHGVRQGRRRHVRDGLRPGRAVGLLRAADGDLDRTDPIQLLTTG